MKTIAKGVLIIIMFFLSLPCKLDSTQGKKLRVKVEEAKVYLEPDLNSPVLENFKKGTILTLGASLKFRKCWYYVYFISKVTGNIHAGYVLESQVEKLYQITKVINISGKEETSPQPVAHFREARWGMTKDEIRRIEGNPDFLERNDALEIMEFRRKVNEKDCLIQFIFVEGKLTKGKYTFFWEQSDKDGCLEHFNKIKTQITESHGQPDFDDTISNTSSFSSDFGKGEARAREGLSLECLWTDKETEIYLSVFSRESDLLLEVEYTGVKFKELLRSVQGKALS